MQTVFLFLRGQRFAASLKTLQEAVTRFDFCVCLAFMCSILTPRAATDGLLHVALGMPPACNCAFRRRCSLSRLSLPTKWWFRSVAPTKPSVQSLWPMAKRVQLPNQYPNAIVHRKVKAPKAIEERVDVFLATVFADD